MSSSIPPEIHDLIVDHLLDEPTALKACCLVSKSWIQRTRKHLFARVKFRPFDHRVESWKKTFPDPTNSPAHHTRSLNIRLPRLVQAAHWDVISAFCRVVSLDVVTEGYDDETSLVPLRGLFPALRSLRLSFSPLQYSDVFALVCSFPCLEDLALHSFGYGRGGPWNTPSTSPRLTGSLELCSMPEGIQTAIRQLLGFPNGLHFTTIKVTWDTEQDVRLTTDLVLRCSDTLQSLTIASYLPSEFPLISVPD